MALARTIRAVRWSVPVGLQLSALYTLLFALILTLLGAALYVQLNKFLVQDAADRLKQATQPVIARSHFFERGEPGRGGFQGGPPPPYSEGQYVVRGLSAPDVTVALLNIEGMVLTTTESLDGEGPRTLPTLPDGWVDSVAAGTPGQWVLPNPDGGRLLVLAQAYRFPFPSDLPGNRIILEQVASLAAADALLNQLRLYVALGIVFGTLIGVVAGLLLTRAVLRPLDKMVSTAEGIAAGDLNRRLRMPHGHNEIARLGGAFDHMVDRLAAGLDAQKRFIADASHELRTPLTSLEGLSEMLLIGADRGDAGVVQRTVRSMHGELARLGRLVTDLLTLSRLDGTTPMPFVCVDASKVAGEVAAQMAPLAESRQVHLVVESQGPVMVRGEPDRLKQVLINLVDNALRYTPPEGEVRLSVADDASTGQAVLRVRDTGPGILPADLPRIFDRFYRGDPSRARSTGSTGLGLAIARAIVQAHGGIITVQSPPGSGAIFTVALPAGAC
ncbi:MAG: sensor histidine kinase [Chloroflexia bacterium]